MNTTQQLQQKVQAALARFEQLAVSEDPPKQVLSQVLQTAVETTRALGGAIWMKSPDGAGERLTCIAQAGSLPLAVGVSAEPLPKCDLFLTKSYDNRESAVYTPDADEFEGTELSKHVQFLVPVEALGRSLAVAQFVFSGSLESESHRSFLAFLQQGARAAGTYLGRRHATVTNLDAVQRTNLLEMIHGLLKFEYEDELAHELATQSCSLLGAYCVCIVSNWDNEIQTICSDPVVDERTDVEIRAIETMAEASIRRDRELTFTRDVAVPEEFEMLEPHLSHLYQSEKVKAICIIPIRRETGILAALVVEYEEMERVAKNQFIFRELAKHAAPILARYVQREQRPMNRLKSMWKHPKIMLSLLVFVIAIAMVIYFLFLAPPGGE